MDWNRSSNRITNMAILAGLGLALVLLFLAALYVRLQGQAPLPVPLGSFVQPALLLVLLFAGVLAVCSLRLLRAGHRLAADKDGLLGEVTRLRVAHARSARRCQQLLDNAGDAIFFIDPQSGSLDEMNRQAEQLLGYAAEEIRNLSLSALFPGRQKRRYLALVNKVLEEGYGQAGDLSFRRKDGQVFIGAVHARLGDLGDAKVVHAVLRDVTAIKRTEQELRKRNRDLTLLNQIAHSATADRSLKGMLQLILDETTANFEATGGGIFLLRHEGNELELAVHTGIEPEVLQDLHQAVPGEGLVGRVVTTGRPRSSTDLRKDSRVRSTVACAAGWRGFQAVPLKAKEKPVGALFLFTRSKRLFVREDVRLLLAIGNQVGTAIEGAQLFDALQWQFRLTQASNRELEQSRQQMKKNLQVMEESNRALAQLDRMKTNFLSLASHELRTPLTQILSGTQLLQETLTQDLGDQEQRVLEAISQGGKRMEGIIQDLLEAARVESQSLYLAYEAIPLPAIIDEIRTEFRPALEQRNITFSLGGFPSPMKLFGDPHHLKKTFRRLLENAVKFTPEGGRIEIEAGLRSQAEVWRREEQLRSFSHSFFNSPSSTRYLQVTVRDTGVGIAPDERLRVFDKFYEIGDINRHSSSQSRFEGTGVGLGLTLVKGMVEAHGGMVWVDGPGGGQAEDGSAFHVLLPLAPGPPAAMAVETPPAGSPQPGARA